jgi:hypothetical protein
LNATELISQLREYANNSGYSHCDYADTMREAANFLAERASLPEDAGGIALSRINLKHGAYITREAKTTGENGWFLFNEHGLVRALNGHESELINGALWATGSATDKATADVSDLREQLRQQGNALETMRERAEKAEAALAARQAPDPRDVSVDRTLLKAACDEIRKYATPAGADDQVVLNLEAALLPKTAQPLQQEGEKPLAWLATDLDGHGDVAFTKEEAKRRAGESCTYFYPLYDTDSMQPPDKLQQASAAQAEPAKCDCRHCIRERGDTIGGLPREVCEFIACAVCGNKRCPHANDHRNACTNSNEPGQSGSAYPASSATNAGQSTVKPVILEQMRDLASQHKMALVPLHVTRAMQEVMDDDGWAWEDLLGAAEAIADDEYAEIVQGLGGLQSRIDQLETLLAATPAQATPEGGQDQAQEAYYFRHLTLCAQGQGFTGITDALNEISNMRAALAASQQAAEPVLWIDADAAPHEDHGELIDGARQIALLGSTKGPFGHYTTPLYRAAPPQQVDTSGLPG